MALLTVCSQELRDIHTDLTEEDIAALATARLAEEQPRDRMWYRINAVKVLGGKSKLQPTVNARLATVSTRRLSLGFTYFFTPRTPRSYRSQVSV